MRAGNPHDTDPWEWSCGFYPGSKPGEIQSGTSETFEEPARNSGPRGRSFYPNRTDGDFPAWRYQRDATAWKYAMWRSRFQTADATADRPVKMFLRR